MARWMEQSLFIEKDFDYLFEKYNPDLLFCSTIYAKQDAILIKAAKRFGVVSLSMPKSWDTFGRLFFRVVSDKVILLPDPDKKEKQLDSGKKVRLAKKQKQVTGKVVASGPLVQTAKAGDTAFWFAGAGKTVSCEGVEYLIMAEKEMAFVTRD